MMTPAEHLRDARRRALAQAEEQAADALAVLESAGGPKIKDPRTIPAEHRGGEWDWLEHLARYERARILERWTSATASSPEIVAEGLRYDDPAAGMDEWLRLTRTVDAARAVRTARRRGASHLSEMPSLGGSSVDEHLTTDYDLAALFAPPETAAEYLRTLADRAEWESLEQSPDALAEDLSDDPLEPASPHVLESVDLVTMADVAEVTGAPIQTVSSWHRRGQMPTPAARLHPEDAPIWHARTILAWLERPTSVAGRRAARSHA
jgi:hypothetical protein